jgi:head-tail adaptor
MDVGALEHRVTLQTAGTPVPDGNGGYTQTPTTLASRVPASVKPATPRDLERSVANTVQSSASHLVTVRYLTGVTTQTQLIFHDGATDRPMAISGMHDPDERHVFLVLACTEVVP